jgi:hypothetical protein
MRISKDLAGRISYALTDKTRKKVDALLKAYQLLATTLYSKQIPDEVFKLYHTHPNYFRTSGTIRWYGNGFGRASVSCDGGPLIAESDGGCELKLTPEIADQLKDAELAHRKAKNEYEDLRRETENTLLALGTSKMIVEKFPLAEKYLPVPGNKTKTMALIPNLENLTEKIKNQ